MWLVWSCIAIVLFAFCEIYEKKGSAFEEPYCEIKLLVWFGIFGLLVAVFISVIGIRETNEGIFSIVLFILALIFEIVCMVAMTYDHFYLLSIVLFIMYIPIVFKYYMNLKKERIAKRQQ